MKLILLTLLLINSISCRHVAFHEKVRQDSKQSSHKIDHVVIELNDEIIVEDSSISEELNPSDQVNTNPIEKDVYLNFKFAKEKTDALLKNCLFLQINENEFIKLRCNKDDDTLAREFKLGPFKNTDCLKMNLRIVSYEPKSKEQCLAKIKANPEKNNCDYQETPSFTSNMGESERFQLYDNSSNDDLFHINFEDGIDWDYADMQFEMLFEKSSRYIFDVISTCSEVGAN